MSLFPAPVMCLNGRSISDGSNGMNPLDKINAPASSFPFFLPSVPHFTRLSPLFTRPCPTLSSFIHTRTLFSSLPTTTATQQPSFKRNRNTYYNGGSLGKVPTADNPAILLCGARRLSSFPRLPMGHGRPVPGWSSHHHPDTSHGPFLL